MTSRLCGAVTRHAVLPLSVPAPSDGPRSLAAVLGREPLECGLLSQCPWPVRGLSWPPRSRSGLGSAPGAPMRLGFRGEAAPGKGHWRTCSRRSLTVFQAGTRWLRVGLGESCSLPGLSKSFRRPCSEPAGTGLPAQGLGTLPAQPPVTWEPHAP